MILNIVLLQYFVFLVYFYLLNYYLKNMGIHNKCSYVGFGLCTTSFMLQSLDSVGGDESWVFALDVHPWTSAVVVGWDLMTQMTSQSLWNFNYFKTAFCSTNQKQYNLQRHYNLSVWESSASGQTTPPPLNSITVWWILHTTEFFSLSRNVLKLFICKPWT